MRKRERDLFFFFPLLGYFWGRGGEIRRKGEGKGGSVKGRGGD